MQSNNGVVETGVEHKRLAFPGKGGYEITWSPGTVHFDLESAPSGHLCISVDDYGKLKPPSGGLPPKQIALLAVGNEIQYNDANDGREVHKLKIQLLSPNAQTPCRATSGAAG